VQKNRERPKEGTYVPIVLAKMRLREPFSPRFRGGFSRARRRADSRIQMMTELMKQLAACVKVACELRPAYSARGVFNDSIHDEFNPGASAMELRMVSAYDLPFPVSTPSSSKLR
jgi:hypothetical protein